MQTRICYIHPTAWTWIVVALALIFLFICPPVMAQTPASDTTLTPIYAIQSAAATTPYHGQWLDTFGIVTARTPTGFFIQDPVGDNNRTTSDGIFVYTRQSPQVDVGECVIVQRAFVDEFYEKTELSRIKSVTPASICGAANVTPIDVSVWREPAGDDNAIAPLELEPYEGMLMNIPEPGGVIQGPTRTFASGEQELAYLPSKQALQLPGLRVFQDQPDRGVPLRYLSSLAGAHLPAANWGDIINIQASQDAALVPASTDATGGPVAVLDYNFGKYQYLLLPGSTVHLESQAQVIERKVQPSNGADFTVCTYNLHGLGRGQEQYPAVKQYNLELQRRVQQIAEWLAGCTILAVQEVGDPESAQALASLLHKQYGLDYQSISLPGPASADPDYPLTNALLVRTSRVAVKSATTMQACSAIDYGVTEIESGASIVSQHCQSGQHPLFNRPPLVVDLVVTGFWDPPIVVRVINNHWKSKAGNEIENAPRRLAQAKHVAAIVQEWLASDQEAHAIVLGDLNDFQHSPPLITLHTNTNPGLVNTIDFVPRLGRYSYIFNGHSQAVDHVLVSHGLAAMLAGVQFLHINADFAAGAAPAASMHVSDHDPLWVRFQPAGTSSLGGSTNVVDLALSVFDNQGKLLSQKQADALGDLQIWNLSPGTVTVHIDDKSLAKPSPGQVRTTLLPGHNPIEPLVRYNRAMWAVITVGERIDHKRLAERSAVNVDE